MRIDSTRIAPSKSGAFRSTTSTSDSGTAAGARAPAGARRAGRVQRGNAPPTVDCPPEAGAAVSRASVARPGGRVRDVPHDLVPEDVEDTQPPPLRSNRAGYGRVRAAAPV